MDVWSQFEGTQYISQASSVTQRGWEHVLMSCETRYSELHKTQSEVFFEIEQCDMESSSNSEHHQVKEYCFEPLLVNSD